MANRFNTYRPTPYVGLPIPEYQAALSTIDTEATQQVQQLGREFAAFNNIKPIGADATAFHKEKLGALRGAVEGLGRKNLRAFDAIRSIDNLVSDPNTISDFTNLYSDVLDYNKMMEANKKYLEDNPDVNLLPQLQVMDNLRKQGDGDAKRYKPGMFRGLDSAPKYYNVPKAMFEFLKEMKASSVTKQWQSKDGSRIYTTEEEALTDPDIRQAAMSALKMDTQAMAQIGRNMKYEAYMNNPENPNEYYGKLAGELKQDLAANITSNDATIAQLEAMAKDPKLKQNVTQIRKDIETLKTNNQKAAQMMQNDERDLASRAYFSQFGQGASDILKYSKNKETWKYDELYMENIKFNNALRKIDYAAKAKAKAEMDQFANYTPQENLRVVLGAPGSVAPSSTTNFADDPALKVLGDLGKDVKDLNFDKPVRITQSLEDLVAQGILKPTDLTRRNNIVSALGFGENEVNGVTEEGERKLKAMGIDLRRRDDQRGIIANGKVTYIKTVPKTDIINGIKENYPYLLKDGKFTPFGAKGKPISVNQFMSDDDLRTVLSGVSQFKFNHASAGRTNYSFGGPVSVAQNAALNNTLASSLTRREILTVENNNIRVEQEANPKVYIEGKEILMTDALRSNKRFQSMTVDPNTGRVWHVYEFEDKDGKPKTYQVQADDQWSRSLSPISQAASAKTDGLQFTNIGPVYVQHEISPSTMGVPTKNTYVLPNLGNPVLVGHADEFVKQYAKEKNLPYNDQTVQSALMELDKIATAALDNDPNAVVLKPYANAGVYDLRLVGAPNGYRNKVTGFALPGKMTLGDFEYQIMQNTMQLNAAQQVQQRNPKYNLELAGAIDKSLLD